MRELHNQKNPGLSRLSWRRLSRRQLGIAGGVVFAFAVLIGYLAWPAGVTPAGPVPPRNVAPFFYAVANLADQPVAHYSGASANGDVSWDISVTNGGEEIGGITIDGERSQILKVGGVTYVKPPQAALAQLTTGGVSAAKLRGRWIAGVAEVTGRIPGDLAPPAELAAQLQPQLMRAKAFPLTSAPETSVDGQSALEASVPGGRLYVSAATPYRVLRMVPGAAAGSTGTGTALTARVSPASGGAAAGGLPATDLQTDTQAEADQTYGSLIGQTKTLDNAPDVGVNVSYSHSGNLNCSDAMCVVTVNIANSATSAQPATLSGSVSAIMTATVTADGEPAGGCTGTGTLPVNGSTSIVCDDPGIAPVISSIKAQQQAQANAGGGGGEYTISIIADAEVETVADVAAEVARQVKTEETEQKQADQQPACPVESELTAAGARPDGIRLLAYGAYDGKKGCGPTSGNSPAASKGKKIHQDFSKYLDSYSEYGYSGEKSIKAFTGIPSSARPDGYYQPVGSSTVYPVELKPLSRAAIRLGLRELAGYEKTMGVPPGSGQLWVYIERASGQVDFVRLQ